MAEELQEILYCSSLAARQAPNVVGQIVSQARIRNKAHDITGLLVFDGLMFCQHLEGSADDVRRLFARIAQDPRHTGVQLVYQGMRDARRYQRFDLGFAEAEEPHGLAELSGLDGTAALTHFLALRPGFDISG